MNLPLNSIICGDCLEVMKDWPDNCVDLILTDPPFGIKFKSNIRLNKFDYIAGDEDLSFLPFFTDQSYRVLKNNSAFYCFTHWRTYSEFYKAINQQFMIKNCLIAPKAKRSMHGDLKASYAPFYDMIIYANKGRRVFERTKFRIADNHASKFSPKPYKGYVYRYEDLLSIFSTVNEGTAASQAAHPTVKNVELMYFLISLSSKKNDTILDCYCGSGTTCVAAKMLGRRYIGIDISEEYCEIARMRLKAVETGVPVAEQRKGQKGLWE